MRTVQKSLQTANSQRQRQSLKQQNPQRQKTKPRRRKTASATLERSLVSEGFSRIVGIDEVGRGAWAGPVAVGAYVFSPVNSRISGVADSKLLSPERRSVLSHRLSGHESIVSFGSVDVINRLGIGKTIERLISSIINRFDDGATYFLIDGRFAPSFHRLSRQIIGGDLQHYSIAAASILAKHARDLVMQKMAVRYDSYGFVTNVGYPSPEHLDALDRFGICPVHRMSFRPIAEIAEQKRLWE